GHASNRESIHRLPGHGDECTRRAIPVAVAEQLVADCYARININEAQYLGLTKKVEQVFDERFVARSNELAELAALAQRAGKTPMSWVRLRLKLWAFIGTSQTPVNREEH